MCMCVCVCACVPIRMNVLGELPPPLYHLLPRKTKPHVSQDNVVPLYSVHALATEVCGNHVCACVCVWCVVCHVCVRMSDVANMCVCVVPQTLVRVVFQAHDAVGAVR